VFGRKELYNPSSDLVKQLSVDFNLSSESISFSGAQHTGAYDETDNPILFVKISCLDVKSAVMISTREDEYKQLTVVLNHPLEALANTSMSNETKVSMVLKNPKEELVKTILGLKFEVKIALVTT